MGNKKIKRLILTLFILFTGFSLYKWELKKSKIKEEIFIEEKLIIEELKKNSDIEIILAKEENLDVDLQKEVVIIYKEKGNYWFVVGKRDNNSKIEFTEKKSAPLEGQEIQFTDFNKDGIIEFIISGYKEENIGYGIYQLENMEVIDIFGEGMEGCC